MSVTFDSLFSDHVLASFDKQLRLADAHGDDDWGFDMTSGVITFNGSVEYQIQILGTEDHTAETWMWGWANHASGIPENLLVASNQLLAIGEEHGVEELTTSVLPMDDLEGHRVGLIASGITGAEAYYRYPYEGGALFVLIADSSLELSVDDELVRATRVIPQGISTFEISDHRRAIAPYLTHLGFEIKDVGVNLEAQTEGRSVMTAKFDRMNRLTKLESAIGPR